MRHSNKGNPYPPQCKLQCGRLRRKDWEQISPSLGTEKKSHNLKDQLECTRDSTRSLPNGRGAAAILIRSERLEKQGLCSPSTLKAHKGSGSRGDNWLAASTSPNYSGVQKKHHRLQRMRTCGNALWVTLPPR